MQTPIAQPVQPQRRGRVHSILEWATHQLAAHGLDEARLHAELLLAHVLRCSRLHLLTHADRLLSDTEALQFQNLLERRLAREPVQYILGETEFMGLPLRVTPAVLIPRPETEQLVEHALSAIARTGRNVDVLDIGTGSGNIAVAISVLASNARVTAMDIIGEALAVAQSNARHHGQDAIAFVQADVFDEFLPGRKFDGIISNPPYISRREFDELQPEIRDYEPRIATTDDGDGLRFVRHICSVARLRVRTGGFLCMEIAYNQSGAALKIAQEAGLRDVRVLPDYAGHPRILSAYV